MNQVKLIEKKRDGRELSSVELEYLITEFVSEKIPPYQMSAFLMAVYFKGMTSNETATLTRLMRDSGDRLELSSIPGFKADKHSTGGVGDKVSLVLAPLVTSAGLIVPMISGRGLAHTGGTLDKLEAIPGFRTNLTLTEIKSQLEKIGVAFVGQTENLCPADKKIYAMRDATATVNSIPLITASILSKKLAEHLDALVLDVKVGSGAIFKDKETAWQLSKMLVKTAQHFDLKTSAMITSMQQPLGNCIGNWLETREAIETLQGNGPSDLLDLTLTLGAEMLKHAKLTQTISQGRAHLQEKIESGAGFDKFLEIVKAQGGQLSVIEKPDSYSTAKHSLEIKSDRGGFVSEIHCREIGVISMDLGSGRKSVEDSVDYASGIVLKKKMGEAVAAGETVAVAHSNSDDLLARNKERLQKAIKISEEKIKPEPLIHGLIDAAGEKKWHAELQEFKPA